MSSEVCETCGKDHRDPKDVELAALRAAVVRLSERLAFLNEIGDKDWCGEHPRRFSANAREGDEGTYDECQQCRAERAEAERDEMEGRYESSHASRRHAEWALEKAQAEVERLRTALEELVTYQNGSPLPTYDEGWANAMRLADEALRGEGEK